LRLEAKIGAVLKAVFSCGVLELGALRGGHDRLSGSAPGYLRKPDGLTLGP
jgi:hypothetical protein